MNAAPANAVLTTFSTASDEQIAATELASNLLHANLGFVLAAAIGVVLAAILFALRQPLFALMQAEAALLPLAAPPHVLQR